MLKIKFIYLIGIGIGFSHSNAHSSEYTHEFFATLQVNQSSGEVNSSNDKKKLAASTTIASFGYGYFSGDVIEPFIEFSLNSEQLSVGNFTQNNSTTDWSIGMLFNIPEEQASPPPQTAGGKKRKKPALKKSLWYPYGGFLISSNSSTGTGGDSVTTKVTKGTMISKLTFGTRYMMFDNVAANAWMRLSYENTADTATAPNEEVGGVSKLSWEIRLFSISVLF